MKTRSWGILLGGVLVAVIALGALGVAFTPSAAAFRPGWGRGWMGSRFGPMMGGPGYPGMGFGWTAGQTVGAVPLTLTEAREAVERALAQAGSTDLTVTEVMEFDRNFYAIASKRDTGAAVLEVLVDKTTGAVFPEYGPAMMWNTEYGHMGASGGHMGGWWGTAPTGTTAVTPERARELAQRWLDTNQPGTTAVDPVGFPGYYTLHTERQGQITGMLSVHATTGQVWYHNWHGGFITTTEVGH